MEDHHCRVAFTAGYDRRNLREPTEFNGQLGRRASPLDRLPAPYSRRLRVRLGGDPWRREGASSRVAATTGL